MFGFDQGANDYKEAWKDDAPRHEGHFSHELIGGAAAFAGMKAYEDRQRENGKPVSHAFAKEMLAGVVGGEVDKLVETKGLDFVDRERAKREATNRAESMYDQHYGDMDQYDPGRRDAPQQFQGGNW